MNGNQGGFGNYAYMASMSVSKLPVSEGNLYPGLAIKPGSAANKELTWEKTSQWNLGLDLTMFDSRLSFSVDAYYKKTTDLLLTVSLPENVVPSSVTRNDGEMVNKRYGVHCLFPEFERQLPVEYRFQYLFQPE